MPFVSEYKCTGCDTKTPRDELVVVRVSFRQMGDFGRTLKSRVTAWLCPACLATNPVWLDNSKSQIESTARIRRKVQPPDEPVEVRSVAPIEPEEPKPVVPFAG